MTVPTASRAVQVNLSWSMPKWTSSKPRAATKPWMSATNVLVIESINAIDASSRDRGGRF